jgi:CHASE2 domain-containing sensor protein
VPGRGANARRLLLAEDLGQAAVAAGSVLLLAYGFWPGAIPALAALLWLGLSARRSTHRRRMTLAA